MQAPGRPRDKSRRESQPSESAPHLRRHCAHLKVADTASRIEIAAVLTEVLKHPPCPGEAFIQPT